MMINFTKQGNRNANYGSELDAIWDVKYTEGAWEHFRESVRISVSRAVSTSNMVRFNNGYDKREILDNNIKRSLAAVATWIEGNKNNNIPRNLLDYGIELEYYLKKLLVRGMTKGDWRALVIMHNELDAINENNYSVWTLFGALNVVMLLVQHGRYVLDYTAQGYNK